ncbi:MAG: class I SAM-dependent methyltransferase [archaeon]|nr:class I SAM-dependent methyltransferase [archaeon]MCP8314423.1 class I SAM-dependent methyltransferase [archaeon]MCP8319371.1 class I SAM-dependent methyltransferase [archaeon]
MIVALRNQFGFEIPGERKSGTLYHQIFGIPDIGNRLIAPAALRMVQEVMPASRLLDLGCGYGRHSLIVAKRLGPHVVGLDISKEKIMEAVKLKRRMKLKNVDFILADALHLPFREHSFHVAIILEVLEHITRDSELVKELSKVLEGASAYVILSTPKIGSTSKMKLLRGLDYRREFGHVREGYILDSLATLFLENSFEIDDNIEVVGPMAALAWQIGWFFSVRKRLRKVSHIVFPLLLLISKLDFIYKYAERLWIVARFKKILS